MKFPIINLKTAIFIVLASWSIGSFAQGNVIMYVMRHDTVVYQSPVSDVNNVTFDGVASGDTLVVQKNNGSLADKIQLNNIQQLSFPNGNLSVETLSGSEVYSFDNIAKLLFKEVNPTGIHNLSAQSEVDVLVSVTPAGDVTVESPAAIKSLTVYSVDGKMIAKKQSDSVGTRLIASLPTGAAGVYLLCVETTQGTVVKKIVKHLNK